MNGQKMAEFPHIHPIDLLFNSIISKIQTTEHMPGNHLSELCLFCGPQTLMIKYTWHT